MYLPLHVMPGDVIVTKESGVWAKAISKLTSSPYNHCSIVSDARDHRGEWLVVDATLQDGVKYRPLIEYETREGVVMRPRLSLKTATAVGRWVRYHIGKKYHRFHFFWLGLHFLTRKFGKHIPVNIMDNDRYLCSHLIGEAFSTYGLEVKEHDNDYLVPKDFIESSQFEKLVTFDKVKSSEDYV